MAAAVRTLKTVRPHIPMIKFPHREKVLLEFSPSTPGVPPPSASSPPPAAADSKPVGSMPRGSGIDYILLPQKYQRKTISVEEMEFIEKGGQV